MCLYIYVGHGVVIVICSPWYCPSSVLFSFSSSLVSCNHICNRCIPIEKKNCKKGYSCRMHFVKVLS